MSFFDKWIQQAQEETEKLIGEYHRSLLASPDLQSIKNMVAGGAPAGSIADRAANTHRGLFASIMASAGPKLQKETRRVKIIEQFCLTLWGKHLDPFAYQALVEKFKAPQPKK